MIEGRRILAVVTTDTKKAGGGAPIFFAGSDEECDGMAQSLSNILDGMAHCLENGTYIIVHH